VIGIRYFNDNRSTRTNTLLNQIQYRSLQLFNKYAVSLSTNLAAGGYILGSTNLIMAIYCLIRRHTGMDSAFLLLGAALVVVATQQITVILITRAIDLRFMSAKIRMSFMSTECRYSGADYRVWKSCSPFSIKVGSFASITTYNFLLIMFQNILNMTINLLLNF